MKKEKEVVAVKPLAVADFVSKLIDSYRSKEIQIETGHVDCEFVDTGNYALNYIMSGSFDDGLPVGQVTEIYGDPSSGKSLLLYNVISNFQQKYPDGVVILDDTENAYVEYLGSSLKIDESRFIRLCSSTVEEHAAVVALGGTVPVRKGEKVENIHVEPMLRELVSKGVKHVLVAIDSIAVLSTRHEIEVGLEKPDMSKAKTIKALLRLITPIIKQYNVTYVITNHLINVINAQFPTKITPGGGGVAYQSSIRLCMSITSKLKLKETNTILGVVSGVQTTKNRFAPPYRKCELEIWYSKGMSRYSGLISLLTNLGIIKLGNGGWYEILGTDNKFQSKELEVRWPEFREMITAKNVLQRDVDVETSKAGGNEDVE